MEKYVPTVLIIFFLQLNIIKVANFLFKTEQLFVKYNLYSKYYNIYQNLKIINYIIFLNESKMIIIGSYILYVNTIIIIISKYITRNFSLTLVFSMYNQISKGE